MTQTNTSPSVLLESVEKIINSKIDAQQASLVVDLTKLMYRDISRDDLANRNDSDLYGAIVSLWHTLNDHQADESSSQSCSQSCINVFNPVVSQHGWQSSHTIVEIVTPDLPFLVDSIRMLLNGEGINSHWLLHQSVCIENDNSGQIAAISQKETKQQRIAVFLIEIDRQSDRKLVEHIKTQISAVIDQVTLAVEDWQPMVKRCKAIIKELENVPSQVPQQQVTEAIAYLNWLIQDKYTFMGYREYALEAVTGGFELNRCKDTSLGLMKASTGADSRKLADLPATAKAEALSSNLVILTKTNSKSQVHRPAYMDYVGIKKFNKQGKVVGEHRFIGLYSSDFYNDSALDIPLIQNKIDRVLQQTGFQKSSHAYKAIINILETYPREELLHAKENEIQQIALGIMQMQERGVAKLFVRKDIFGRYFSCMAYVPRDKYNTQLRKATQSLFQQHLSSDKPVEFNTYLSESSLARTHYMVRVANNNFEIDEHAIQSNMIELTKTWDDKFERCLVTHYGEEKGKSISQKYENAFSRSYKESEMPSSALVDIAELETLSDDNKLGMIFYRPQEAAKDSVQIRLKLFHRDEPIHLSDVLPMLENFGLKVIDERPHKVTACDGHVNWILDFSMEMRSGVGVDLDQSRDMFQQAFQQVWAGELENDGFNRLVLQAKVAGREAAILRAYAKYMRQIGTSFSQNYIENTFTKYPQIARQLIELFACRFNPNKGVDAEQFDSAAQDKLVNQIELALENVANLDDDRIIRRYVDMTLATLRTNFYQETLQGTAKSYISFKLSPKSIPDIPKPVPFFEIFVYSPRVEGVHLRGGKVARGGLRWSDRREDFRTEVLGLVKAQQVKNTVIVPVGAKGGFVCKQLPETGGRDAFFAEGQACYRIFIRALLDVTDNIQKGDIVPPPQVVRHDEDDAYLVVAADKGTATFSDIANSISDEYEFWLGDAFASGGSVGYDHKKMGITARGAWESVKRHFREVGINCQSTDFTCVAVGDMAGDVFGNGMLLSEHTCLVAAFNHMHIFIDPTPNAATSYKERSRLFESVSGWAEYNQTLISKGGGLFERSAKSIKLTKEIKQLIGTNKDAMAPNELIHQILQMKADLLWNGGIGTYIKSKKESHSDVGDRANDAVRINGEQANFKIIGEGGNLGCTQLGRIEAAKKGCRVNTDFIDNVGGVDCSDKEVNIKILLNSLVADGELTLKKRNDLLYSMTDEVAEIVLKDCYRQTHSLSVTQSKIRDQLKEQTRFIHGLEKMGALDRELEFLPSDDDLADRQAAGKGLTQPELSVLIAYAKMVLKEQFNIPEITQESYLAQSLLDYFPKVLKQKFSKAMQQHPLKSEIIATQVANDIINDMGLNFVHRMSEETGANSAEVAICYTIAKDIFDLPSLWKQIEAWDNQVSADIQSEALFQLRRTVRRATRWFLRHRSKSLSIKQSIDFYKPVFTELSQNLDLYLVEGEHQKLVKNADKLVAAGVDNDFAKKLSYISTLFSVMDIAQVVDESQRPLTLVADVYYKLGAYMELHWFLEQINLQPVANHWQALARAAFREELDWQQRSLAAVILRSCTDKCNASDMLDAWAKENNDVLERWRHMLADFKATRSHEFAKFSVALRELMLLSHHCDTQT